MKLLDFIRRMFVARICILCDEAIDRDQKSPFCEDCVEEWDNLLETRCNRCGEDRHTCNCLPHLVRKNFKICCWSVFYTPNHSEEISLTHLLVYRLKYSKYRDCINFCAEVMKNSLIECCKKHGVNYKEYAITYSPRRLHNRLRYEFDQSKELAKRIAFLLGLDFVEALDNIGHSEQKKLSAIERRRNAQESYKLKKGFVNNHKKYFIVDDIMTSGATLVYCSRLLYGAGATDVIPVTYAKDNYKYKGD